MGWSLLALLHSIPFFQFSVHGNIHESTIGTSVGRPSSVPSVALFVCSILTPSRPPSKSARPRCSAPSAGLRIGRSAVAYSSAVTAAAAVAAVAVAALDSTATAKESERRPVAVVALSVRRTHSRASCRLLHWD